MSDTPGTHMRTEIAQQPQVLRALLANAPAVLAPVLDAIKARKPALAVLAARGSSDNASTYGKYLLESMLGLPVALAAPSLFTLYQQPPNLRNALVIGVSQSGGSLDVVEVVTQARAQGALTLGITNTNGSELHRAAEHKLLLHAGLEKALAATKTVSAQCLAYAMLALPRALTTRVPDEVAGVIADAVPAIAMLLPKWLHAQRGAVIGRGYTYGAAQEIALKLKETCFFGVEPYSGADFMHGPLALAEPGYPMLVLANHDATLPTTLALIEKARARDVALTVWSTRAAAAKLPVEADVIIDADARTAPISFIVLGQMFALSLALARDIDPDLSRGVSKVTVTL